MIQKFNLGYAVFLWFALAATLNRSQ